MSIIRQGCLFEIQADRLPSEASYFRKKFTFKTETVGRSYTAARGTKWVFFTNNIDRPHFFHQKKNRNHYGSPACNSDSSDSFFAKLFNSSIEAANSSVLAAFSSVKLPDSSILCSIEEIKS